MSDRDQRAVEPPTNDRPLVLAFWLMLGAALWSWSLSWNASLLDRHESRQTQTALSAHWIMQDGYRVDYETPVFGPPWSVPMEFPVYQWIAVQCSRVTGLPLEQSGRAVSILFLLATLPAVFLLAGIARLSRPGRLLVVAAVLSAPIYLFYGRTFMIETTALCFSVWFLLATGRAVRDLNLRWSALAAVCGPLAALTKVTTFAVYCFPAVGLALWLGWRHWRERRQSVSGLWRAILLGGTPLVLAAVFGAWWVRHTDAVKGANPFSNFLKSSELTAWNWGTFDQRFSAAIWQEFWTNLSQSVLGEPALVVLAVCFVVVNGRWQRWAAAGAAGFMLAPLLFTNLYYRHEYYYSANSLLLLAGAGMLLAGMWVSSALPRALKMTLLGLFFCSQLLVFYRGDGRDLRRSLPRPPEIAEVIRRIVPADDVLLIYGWEWNALIPYYSQRRAVMVPGTREYEFKTLDRIMANLPPRRVAAMLVHRALFDAPLPFVRERCKRFGLVPSPFATSSDGDLYLPRETFERSTREMAGWKFESVTFFPAPTGGTNEADLLETDLTTIDFSFFTPKPSSSHSLFGLSNWMLGKQPVLLAHAPSEICFVPPAGASHVSAEFGLVEGAYTGEAPFTDGIGVTVSEERPDQPPRVLFRRELDPARNPADRGVQKIDLTSADGFSGQLLFAIDSGPKHSPAKDWAYWGRIEIR